MKHSQIPAKLFMVLLLAPFLPAAQPEGSRKPVLIQDTDVAEAKEDAEAAKVKEPNPELSAQNLKIGDFYFKRKNYRAAIERYLEAVEYQQDSIPACEALAKAYEKTGEISKAIKILKNLLEKNPESSKSPEIRNKLSQLEKKSG
jgi:outer membrane protein assembly factor BamD (BamD/ComL family)